MFWSWFPLLRLGSTSPQLRLSFLDRHTNNRIRTAERGRAGRSESPSFELEPEMRPNKGSRAAYVAAPYIHPIEVSRPPTGAPGTHRPASRESTISGGNLAPLLGRAEPAIHPATSRHS